VCVCIYLVIQHAPCCHLWPARLYNLFTHYLINGTIFEKKKVIEHEMCFDFLYNYCLIHFSFGEELSEIWSKMYIELHVKWSLLLSDFNEILIFSTDFRKMLSGVCSSCSAVPCTLYPVKILPYPSRRCPQAEFNFSIGGHVPFTQIQQLEIYIVNIFSLRNSDCNKLATFGSKVLQILPILLPVPQRSPSVFAIWTTKLFSLLYFTY
jgi:hypothetical protein